MQQATSVTQAPVGKWIIAGTVVLSSFVSVMDFSIVNVAMPQMISTFGVTLMVVGYLEMSGFTLEVGLPQMLPSFLLTGAGMSIMFGPLSAVVMRSAPLTMIGAASSLYTLGRRIGGNVGYAFVASQVEHRMVFHRARLVDHLTSYDVRTHQALDGLTGRLATSGGLPPGVAEGSAIKLLDVTVNRHASMLAYNDIFWLMGMMFVIGVPFLLLLGGRRKA